MGRYILVLLCLCLLDSCAMSSLDRAYVSNPVNRVALEPFRFELSHDPYLLRTDLVRASHAEDRTTPVSNGTSANYITQSIQVDNAYFPVAIDFGNGLMVDANLNVFVDLSRFYSLRDLPAYKAKLPARGLFGADTLYTKTGSNFVENSNVIGGSKREVEVLKDTVSINSTGFLNGHPKYRIYDTGIEYDPGALFESKLTYSQPSIDTINIPTASDRMVFRLVDLNHARLEQPGILLDIVQKGNTVAISRKLGQKPLQNYTFFRTSQGFVFYNNASYEGVEVRKIDKNITTWINSKVLNSLQFE